MREDNLLLVGQLYQGNQVLAVQSQQHGSRYLRGLAKLKSLMVAMKSRAKVVFPDCLGPKRAITGLTLKASLIKSK